MLVFLLCLVIMYLIMFAWYEWFVCCRLEGNVKDSQRLLQYIKFAFNESLTCYPEQFQHSTSYMSYVCHLVLKLASFAFLGISCVLEVWGFSKRHHFLQIHLVQIKCLLSSLSYNLFYNCLSTQLLVNPWGSI